jgi:4-hydroxy-2-oxoheptanedioate aldolase
VRRNIVKDKLRDGEPTFGTWLSLGSVFAARFLARVGFDWLTVDLEHSPTDWETAALMFGAISDAGCVALARVPRGEHQEIKRALDAGAMGIVVPMVNTVQQAEEAIRAAKYPPEGNRSLGGSLHSLNFGLSVAEYFQRANDEILVVLQTESPLGIENAPRIYALPGVDAIFVGPNDLRANLRPADGREPTEAEFQAALQRILAVGRQTGTPVGIHVQTAEEALVRTQEGWQFLAIASELAFMLRGAKAVVQKIRPEAAQQDLARY